ncbi:hypothetical protein ACIBCD_11370 [Nocardia brasiliensis]|uniref:hypothetical protein n=1 Tax=Nocardia brasiliensis TaxID=37326 RepID=UPI0037876079
MINCPGSGCALAAMGGDLRAGRRGQVLSERSWVVALECGVEPNSAGAELNVAGGELNVAGA